MAQKAAPVQADLPAGIGADPAKTRLQISAFAVLSFLLAFGSICVRNIVGWPGFLLLALALIIWGSLLFAKHRNLRFAWHRMPKPLLLFLLLCLVSISWSAYRLESFAGFLATLATTWLGVILATVLTWHEVLRTQGTALRYLLGLSLVFELVVEVFVHKPVLQNFVEVANPDKPSKLLYWSRALLFDGGPIQGVIANSALLGFFALLGLIVFAVQLRGGLVRPVNGWFWLLVAAVVFALTRPSTVIIAVPVVLLAALFVKWARVSGTKRAPVYITGALLSAAAIAVVETGFWRQISIWLGEKPTLNGRTEIWSKTLALAEQKPAFGWGWVSHWAPWVEPFKSLDTKVGIQVMHAHNAWLDVFLQLGWAGLAVFALLILMTTQRLWCRAVDQPRRGALPPLPYATSAVFPFLFFVALLVQSLTESRLLYEWGWLVLVLFAVKTRIDYELPTKESEPVAARWRDVPIAH